MWTIPYLVSVLCMHGIARCKRELEAPSDSEERKKLEEQIQRYESLIKNNKKMDKNGAGGADTGI